MVLVILHPNTTPQIQDNQNHQEDNIKEKDQSDDPNGSGNSSPNTTPQTQDNQNHQWMIILKKKNKVMTLMVLVILLQDTNPQIQDNQNHQEDNIKEKEQSDDPKYLLEQLEKIQKWLWKNRKRKWKLNKKLRITLMF
ncbi:hypothetical protein HYD83_02320 [Mycoplasmopsis bovis]|nr:hypothetical protein [Mycoplasmopsis bovis]QQH37350.1 hypothetical protein HYD83_02320 [Mycoplasmopsis bovis]